MGLLLTSTYFPTKLGLLLLCKRISRFFLMRIFEKEKKIYALNSREKMLLDSLHSVEILREIKVGKSRVSKSAILAH